MRPKLSGVWAVPTVVGLIAIVSIVLHRSVFHSAHYRFRDCNVLLISIDTLRPDHLHCYGYDRRTSQAVDQLAADGVLFKTAIAQAPSTLPSHASMFTSLIPSHHGAFHHAGARVASSVPTMAEILLSHGYRTAGFHGGGQMSPAYGLDRGFESYKLILGEHLEQVVDEATAWLESSGSEKFFMFLHTYEVHVPYRAPPEYLARFEDHYAGDLPDTIRIDLLDEINFGDRAIDEQDLGHIVSAYDTAIFTMDRALGRLIDFLKRNEIYDNTIIIFTSDHGEEFREHGKVGYHCHTVYDELIKVPMITKFPRSMFASTVIEEQVRSIDILPTILDLLAMNSSTGFDGASMLPLMVRGRTQSMPRRLEDDDLFALSERDDAAGPHHIMSIRTGEMKLYVIKKGDKIVRRMLYYLSDDPKEERNLLSSHKQLADSLWRQFERMKAQRSCPPLESAKIDEETRERLRSLGYVQ